jgi:DNA-binding NtrC family response regulator
MEAERPDLVISDLRMPEMDGLDLLQHARERWPGVPVILLSVVEDVATVVEAVQRGASNYILKPATPATILAAIEKSLAAVRAHLAPPPRIPEILGITRCMVEVRRLVTFACSSDVNVLITGETGTGKELVARAVHRYSRLASGPFIAHNCAASPPELFESQFFGHRKGAFTGALADHTGFLEQADGGVLLLDELQALSSHNQAKLLRVLDDGEVRPVGSAQVRRVSVRFLSATNRDPQRLVREGILREDLYYRLRGLEIRPPPLRERRRDIPILARHFLGPEDGTFTPEALEALHAYPWPGNVRQLRNCVRSAKAAAGKGLIGLRHLSIDRGAPVDVPLCRAEGQASTPHGVTRLEDLERQAIRAALQEFQGNLSRAACALGIDRSTLRRKLQEMEDTHERDAEGRSMARQVE